MAPITREQLLANLEKLKAPAPDNVMSIYHDPEGRNITPPESAGDNIRQVLKWLDQYGVNSTQELPAEVQQWYDSRNTDSKTFGSQVGNFITHPAFLTAAGGATGITAGTTTGAIGGGALGSGLTAGGAATGTGAAAGAGALGAGYFGSEAAYPVSGGQTAAVTGGTAAGGAGTGGATTTGTTAASGTALSRVLGGSGTTEDYLQLFGQAAPSLLGMYASNQQTNALEGLANQYASYGAPYREQLANISNDPDQFYNSPGAQGALQATLRKLSVNGNPAGSPYMQALATDSLYRDYGAERDRLAGYGGLTQYNSAVPGLATGAINSTSNFYNSLGYGIGSVTNPPQSLSEMLKNYSISQGQ